MARMSDDAQWIILMGFIVSFSLFFLATVIDQSTLVGQTTAENVQDFGKNDIRDVRAVIINADYNVPMVLIPRVSIRTSRIFPLHVKVR